MIAFNKIQWIEALAASSLSDRAVRLGVLLAKHRNSASGDCFPSQERLAEAASGWSTKKVQRAAKELEEAGWVKISGRKGGGRTFYNLLMSNIPDPAATEQPDNIVQLRAEEENRSRTSAARSPDTRGQLSSEEPDTSVQIRSEKPPRNRTILTNELDNSVPQTGHQRPPNLEKNQDNNLNEDACAQAWVLPPEFRWSSGSSREQWWVSVNASQSTAWMRWAQQHYKRPLNSIAPQWRAPDGTLWFRVPCDHPPKGREAIIRVKVAFKKVREYNEGKRSVRLPAALSSTGQNSLAPSPAFELGKACNG